MAIARNILVGFGIAALAGCGGAPVESHTTNDGQQALNDASDSADDADDAIDDAIDAIDDADGDVDACLDAALDAVDAGRGSLEEAARAGACRCDVAALEAAIAGGDDDLQPILDGCNAASPEALELAEQAPEGLCEEIAHALGDAEDLVADLAGAQDAFDDAQAACDDAYAAAQTNIDAAQAELQAACGGTPEECAAASDAFEDTVASELAAADEACQGVIDAADDLVDDAVGADDDAADDDAVGADDDAADDDAADGDVGQGFEDAEAICEAAYAEADAIVAELQQALEEACSGGDSQTCTDAAIAFNDGVNDAYATADETCLAAIDDATP